MIGPWERIEGSAHDDELDSGVEARVADPLWMLARQWQTGEFRGDDAGSPIAAQLAYSIRTLQTYRAGAAGPIAPIAQNHPLERVVEAAPLPQGGAAGLHWSARLAGQITRRLRRGGHDDALDLLRRKFVLPEEEAVALPGAGSTTVDLLRRHSFDGAALFQDNGSLTETVLSPLPADQRTAVLDVIDRWRHDVSMRLGLPQNNTWDDERLEHRFSVATGKGTKAIVLTADAYTGGHLDWYSFDVDYRPPRGSDHGATDGAINRRATAIPTPVRYAGMPMPRWWAFEEGDIHFGDIAAAPGDLGRLLLADYATVYGNDWYSIPLRLPLGTLTRIDKLYIYDTMGQRTRVPAAALLDDREPDQRVFRLYELHGDTSVASGLAPFLFLPPSLSGSEIGPVLEQIDFVRDETANLVWGIERHVEGPTGRSVDRLQHWRTAVSPDDPSTSPGNLKSDALAAQPLWRYRLEAAAPPFWIPFVPVRIGSGEQIRLRRARMQQWNLLDRIVVGPKGELLRPDRPMVVAEETVPRGGVTLQRRWQVARWTDGSLHIWLQRSKRLGYGERSSGVRWDILEEVVEDQQRR